MRNRPTVGVPASPGRRRGQDAWRLIVSVMALVVGASAAASGGNDLALGREVYNRSCVACHGADGAGAMPGVPDFTDREGPLAKADAALTKAILEGVEGSTAPTPMPPKGGDPTLTEQDVRYVLGYIRAEFGPCGAGDTRCATNKTE